MDIFQKRQAIVGATVVVAAQIKCRYRAPLHVPRQAQEFDLIHLMTNNVVNF